jgi:hypothetical protein
MSQSGGVGDTSSVPNLPGLGATEGVEAGSVEAALHTPVKTLGELKKVLVSNFGEKTGMKVYNQFMMSFAMLMMQQMQDSAEHAKKASQDMRTDTH